MKLRAIANALSADVAGDDGLEVRSIVHPADASGEGELALALGGDALAALDHTRAEAVVVATGAPVPQDRFKAVVYADPSRRTLAILTSLFDSGPQHESGVHPTAQIGPGVDIGAGVSIGAYAVIGAGSRIGPHTTIMPHVTIGAGVRIGANGLICAGVRIGDRVVIGDRVIVQPNAVIGADGFSFIPVRMPDGTMPGPERPMRIHSLGQIVIGDDVEIGAGTTIDRATLRATRIGNGTKIDNLVQIGHNVTIGECCLIAGMTGIAGSTTVGDRVMIGGGVGIADHTTIGSNATIAAGSGVGTSVPEGAIVSGYPAMRHERTMEHILYLGRQKALHQKVQGLQSRLEALENAAKAAKRG